MNRHRTSTLTTGLALVALLALSGCGDDGPPPSEAAGPIATTTTPATVTTPAAPTAASPTRSPAVLPKPISAVQQGATYYSVVLAVVRGDAVGPANTKAVAQARAVGVEAFNGDIACLHGAAEALKLDPTASYTATSVEFATRAQAQQFVDAYAPGVVGTAKVQTFCVDG